MRLIKAAILAVALAVTAPITVAQDADDDPERICINVRAIRNFDAITDAYVYVREGSNRHYLLTLQRGCHYLSNALSIAITDTTSRVCNDGFGDLVYRERLSGGRLQSCRIENIELFSSKEDAEAVAKARTETARDQ